MTDKEPQVVWFDHRDFCDYLWHALEMALENEDIKRIAELIQPLRDDITQLRTEMNAQFDEVQNNFEGLYSRDEKREQEYLILRGQLARLESRVDELEKKVA